MKNREFINTVKTKKPQKNRISLVIIGRWLEVEKVNSNQSKSDEEYYFT